MIQLYVNDQVVALWVFYAVQSNILSVKLSVTALWETSQIASYQPIILLT